jgi:hypothetical protein
MAGHPFGKQTRNWASAAYLRHDPAMRPFASGFDARSILPPTCGWKCVDAEFQAMVLDKARILQLASRPESSSVRTHVWDALEVAHNPRITDFDLRGYRSAEPGWIADRICCLAVAVEIPRMIIGNEHLNAYGSFWKRIRQPASSCRKCRIRMRRTHGSCHFPASCDAGAEARQRQAHR